MLMTQDQNLRVRGHNGEVTFDGKVIEINREGFPMFKRSAGRGTKRLAISSITAVQLKQPGGGWTANRFGFIEFSFMGGKETKGFGVWGGGIGQVQRNWKDENTVIFKSEHLSQFKNLQEVVEDAIFSRNSTNDSSSAPLVKDKYDQLNKLKVLLDSGALTQVEFDIEKQNILG